MKDDKLLNTYIKDIRPRFEGMLGQAVEIPSISMDPAYAKDIRRMADLAAQYFRDLGAEATVVETAGYPVISGGWTTGSRHPTVTVYNHMDVQPAQEPEWRQAVAGSRRARIGPTSSAVYGCRSPAQVPDFSGQFQAR